MRMPEQPEDLELLILVATETRVLTREGVQFNKLWYKGRAQTDSGHMLADLIGRRVVLRHHPDDDRSILVYDEETRHRIGEFLREDLWSAEWSASRENQSFVSSLKERTVEYAKMIQREDRTAAKVARQAEIATLVKEREEQDEAAGIRKHTHAEARQRKRDAESPRAMDDYMKDLL